MNQSSAILIAALAATILVVPTPVRALTVEQEAKLLASDGAPADRFGYSIAVHGDTAIVGARDDDTNGDNSGSVYVFQRSGTDWTELTELLAPDGAPYDEFGYAVALHGDTAVIGAPDDDDNGFESGSAYVYTRTAGVWTLHAKLTPPDGDIYDGFGKAVAIDGDTTVIGSAYSNDGDDNYGAAYVYTRSGNVWQLKAKLVPSDGALDHFFGWSVAIDADTIIVGAYFDNENGPESGSAYVYTRTGDMWTERAKLLPSDGAAEDFFGYGLALQGDTAIIGSFGDSDNGYYSGSAYVFTGAGDTWTEQAKLLPADGVPDAGFGVRIGLEGDSAIIGAYADHGNGPFTGSAYVFVREAGEWTEHSKLVPSDIVTNAQFGWSVDLEGDTAVVGAARDDDNGEYSGSAYVYRFDGGDGGDGGGGGVPANGTFGTLLMVFVLLGSSAYFLRR